MIEQLRFHSIAQLQSLSLIELQALWELVPTDRQRAYRAAYDREVRNAGAIGSDSLERQVTLELLRRYEADALVPVGSRWARTPSRVQTAARDNAIPDLADDAGKASDKPSPRMVMGIALGALVVVMFLVPRLFGGGGMGDAEPEVTPEVVITPTTVNAAPTPTPTPLALEAQDDVITGGDSSRAVAYPVNLQVILPDTDIPPRVWVVQRRAVAAAEWHFDPNPDIAAFINGMSVRPVIGIPWSEDNADWFERMGEGTVFNLTMNTGAILRYEFASSSDVRRSDTRIFRQVGPGLVLLLIGETDEMGLPTGTRRLVTATYPPEQELSRGSEVIGISFDIQEGQVGETLPLGDGATIGLRAVRTDVNAPDVPAGQQMLVFELDIAAGEADVDTTLWRVDVYDGGGQIYLPQSDDLPPQIPALALIPTSIRFVVPEQFPGGRMVVTAADGQAALFRFALDVPALDVQYDGVDVRLVSVTTLDGQISTRLRIYNGQVVPITFTQDDIWLALGYAPDPPGPRNPAEGLQPFTLLPEQAVDLTLVWYWAGEPYAALQVGSYRFAIQLTRES